MSVRIRNSIPAVSSAPPRHSKGIVSALLTFSLIFMAAACSAAKRPASADRSSHEAARSSTLHPLDERNAAAFRRVFDDARAHDRYIAALSPT